MAILKAPLLSLSARKSLAKTITYRNNRGRPVGSAYTVPSHNPNQLQLENEARLTRDVEIWRNHMTAVTDREAYKQYGRQSFGGLPAYQTWMKSSYAAETGSAKPFLLSFESSTEGPPEASIHWHADNINALGTQPAIGVPYQIRIGSKPTQWEEFSVVSTGAWEPTFITGRDWRYPYYFQVYYSGSGIWSGIYRVTS